MIDRAEILNCLPTFHGDSHHCMTCLAPVPDFVPDICCDGTDCPCNGLPLEPCFCAKCDPAMNPVPPPVDSTDPEPRAIGELTTTEPLSNPERFALFILKRGEMPFFRVWPQRNQHVESIS